MKKLYQLLKWLLMIIILFNIIFFIILFIGSEKLYNIFHFYHWNTNATYWYNQIVIFANKYYNLIYWIPYIILCISAIFFFYKQRDKINFIILLFSLIKIIINELLWGYWNPW